MSLYSHFRDQAFDDTQETLRMCRARIRARVCET